MSRLSTTVPRWALAVLLVASQSLVAAAPGQGAGTRTDPYPDPAADGQRRWSAHVDNDLLVFGDADRDYTAGVAFSLEGDAARRHALSPSGALEWIDARTHFDGLFSAAAAETPALEVGLLLFTPHEITASEPLDDDRPYANLIYIGSTRLVHEPASSTAYQSSLIVGLLGLPFVEQLHRGVHDIVGADEPRGYGHQISDGGEPTFRYSVSKYRLLAASSYAGRPYSLRLGLGASVGYLTEGSIELGIRWGTANTAWWSSFSENADYGGHPSVTQLPNLGAAQAPALQFSAGIKLRARLYNSFLQGQFRDSDVTYSSSGLSHLLLEGWIGFSTVLRNGLSISYTIRHQTEELETGRGARGFTWGSLSVAQRF